MCDDCSLPGVFPHRIGSFVSTICGHVLDPESLHGDYPCPECSIRQRVIIEEGEPDDIVVTYRVLR